MASNTNRPWYCPECTAAPEPLSMGWFLDEALDPWIDSQIATGINHDPKPFAEAFATAYGRTATPTPEDAVNKEAYLFNGYDVYRNLVGDTHSVTGVHDFFLWKQIVQSNPARAADVLGFKTNNEFVRRFIRDESFRFPLPLNARSKPMEIIKNNGGSAATLVPTGNFALAKYNTDTTKTHGRYLGVATGVWTPEHRIVVEDMTDELYPLAKSFFGIGKKSLVSKLTAQATGTFDWYFEARKGGCEASNTVSGVPSATDGDHYNYFLPSPVTLSKPVFLGVNPNRWRPGIVFLNVFKGTTFEGRLILATDTEGVWERDLPPGEEYDSTQQPVLKFLQWVKAGDSVDAIMANISWWSTFRQSSSWKDPHYKGTNIFDGGLKVT